MRELHSSIDTECLQLPPELMNYVHDAISWSWVLLLEDIESLNGTLEDLEEDAITTMLCTILNKNRLKLEGMKTFQPLDKGGRIRNKYGTRISREPDIIFKPLPGLLLGSDGNPKTLSENGLHVECKIIKKGGAGMSQTYFKDGMLRFVENQYGWALDCGMMLGYALDTTCLPDGFTDTMSKMQAGNRSKFHMNGALAYHRDAKTKGCEEVYISIHDRPDPPNKQVSKSPPINLHHMWLHEKSNRP